MVTLRQMIRFITCIGIMLVTLPSNGQQKVWKHYTLDDGLPAMNAWSIVQAKNGMLWFSSDKGIFSYDGYDFHEPVDTSVYIGSETFFPAEDQNGRIWFSRIDRTVWYIEADTIRAWQLNHVLDTIRAKFFLIYQIGFESNGDIWLHAGELGFVVVDVRGDLKIIRGSDSRNFSFGQVGGNLMFGFQADNTYLPSSRKLSSQILHWNRGVMEMVGSLPLHASSNIDFFNAAKIEGDKVVIKHGQDILFWQNGKLEHLTTLDIRRSRLTASEKSQLVLTCDHEQQAGLYYYSTMEAFKDNKGVNILPGILTYYALFDHAGGLWVSTRGEGLFYCKEPGIDVFDLNLFSSSNSVNTLAWDGQQTLYAGVGTYAIRFDLTSQESRGMASPGLVDLWTLLYYDPDKNSIWAGSPLKILQGDDWKEIKAKTSDKTNALGLNAKSISISPDRSRMWMSSTFGFYEVDIASLAVSYHPFDTSLSRPWRTYDVLEDRQNRIWVSTIEGLRIYINGRYTTPPFEHPAMRYRISSLLLQPEGSIVFGTMGAGILIYTEHRDLIHLTTADGLTSDFITSVKAGNESTFFACTDAGLNTITLDEGGQPILTRISKVHGLPSDIILDVVSINNDLWIGTDKGLVYWRMEQNSIRIPAPVITSFVVNQEQTLQTGNSRFSHIQNHIEIAFRSIHFRSEGKIHYRYRLAQSDTTFRSTLDRRVNFPELAPGRYIFEVQSKGEDGQWSESAIRSFLIRPPWWRTAWFWSLSILGAACIGYFLIARRNRAVLEKVQLGLKMKELELAALRAQINPHFIFNCLGSIQQFIAGHDADTATRYLARFAKLIRLALHSSVDGKHSLADEIAMLDNYLALEQMRFKGSFHYQIDAAGIGDSDDIHIPPMLLQPFVENAVKHGIGHARVEGEIKITFTKIDNLLLVVITDNGPGFSTRLAESNEAHKSVGLSLTRSRLDILSGFSERSSYTQENITDLNGQVKGARVDLRIPLD